MKKFRRLIALNSEQLDRVRGGDVVNQIPKCDEKEPHYIYKCNDKRDTIFCFGSWDIKVCVTKEAICIPISNFVSRCTENSYERQCDPHFFIKT